MAAEGRRGEGYGHRERGTAFAHSAGGAAGENIALRGHEIVAVRVFTMVRSACSRWAETRKRGTAREGCAASFVGCDASD